MTNEGSLTRGMGNCSCQTWRRLVYEGFDPSRWWMLKGIDKFASLVCGKVSLRDFRSLRGAGEEEEAMFEEKRWLRLIRMKTRSHHNRRLLPLERVKETPPNQVNQPDEVCSKHLQPKPLALLRRKASHSFSHDSWSPAATVTTTKMMMRLKIAEFTQFAPAAVLSEQTDSTLMNFNASTRNKNFHYTASSLLPETINLPSKHTIGRAKAKTLSPRYTHQAIQLKNHKSNTITGHSKVPRCQRWAEN